MYNIVVKNVYYRAREWIFIFLFIKKDFFFSFLDFAMAKLVRRISHSYLKYGFNKYESLVLICIIKAQFHIIIPVCYFVWL